MTREPRMFGLWDSPISAKMLSLGIRLSEPCWDTNGQTLAWVEGRSDRGIIVVQDVDGGPARDLTSDISVRAFVGYGGGDFTLAHGAAYFVGQADQRIYRQELAGGSAQANHTGLRRQFEPRGLARRPLARLRPHLRRR